MLRYRVPESAKAPHRITASKIRAFRSIIYFVTTAFSSDGIPTLAFSTASNRITTSGFEYDVAGNQTRTLAEDGVSWLRFEYEAANRVRYVKQDNGTLVQAFIYGAGNGRLIDYDALGTGRNTFYASVGGSTLVEYLEYNQNIPTWTKSYTYLGDSQLSTVTPNGSGGENVEYNHPDRLGTRVITNQSTGGNSEQAHLPFGRPLDAESTVTNNNKRFTSYDRSPVTKLDYAINRTYDSKQGRFTQVDPIGMSASSLAAPQTLNLYTYCGNDPINHVDPSGLFWGSLFRWIGRIIRVIMIAIAVVIAVAVIFFPPLGITGLQIAAALLTSASLLATGLGAPKIGAIIGIASGIVLSGPGIIVNLAQTVRKASLWQNFLHTGNFVGSITNSFTSKGDKEQRRRRRLIGEAVRGALWRLKNMPGCKDLIEGGPDFPAGKDKWDAEATLKTIYQSGGIVMDDSIPLTGQTDSPGTGPNTNIRFKGKFFDPRYAAGNIHGLNPGKARQLILLHELRHATVGGHIGIYDNDGYNDQIAKKCFGLKF